MMIGLYLIPVEEFAPKPGDIICIVNGDVGTVHRLNGPYERKDIEEVMSLWANQYLECGDEFSFFYEPLDGGPAEAGESKVWHFSHLN